MSDLKIFTENIETEALKQIHALIEHPAFVDCKVRIMPDCHLGKGCVIGFTADLRDKVIPNIVGVDISCGMLTVELGNIDIDLPKLDEVIRKYVPSGQNIHDEENGFAEEIIDRLYCKDKLKNVNRIKRSLGTLGNGNHFCELDIDDEGNKYLVIHSGSRNLGKQVAEIYQQMAVGSLKGKNNLADEIKELIADYKRTGRHKDIERGIATLKRMKVLWHISRWMKSFQI